MCCKSTVVYLVSLTGRAACIKQWQPATEEEPPIVSYTQGTGDKHTFPECCTPAVKRANPHILRPYQDAYCTAWGVCTLSLHESPYNNMVRVNVDVSACRVDKASHMFHRNHTPVGSPRVDCIWYCPDMSVFCQGGQVHRYNACCMATLPRAHPRGRFVCLPLHV